MKDIMNRPDNEVISLQPRTQVTKSVRQTWVPAKINLMTLNIAFQVTLSSIRFDEMTLRNRLAKF